MQKRHCYSILMPLQLWSLLLLAGCGSSEAKPIASPTGALVTVSTPAASTVTVSTPTASTGAPAPTPDQAPTGTAVISELSGTSPLADNFTTSLGLEATGYGPSGSGGLPAESVDTTGAFRIFCTAGQLAYDDPIVYPGQPGKSHLHQFYGNTGANASSSYSSLRTSGGTTCGTDQAHPVNRSAYWFPAMLDGEGNVVRPRFINLYYKQHPISSPECKQSNTDGKPIGICTGLPNGLRFIFGYNMATMTGGPNDTNSVDYWNIRFECHSNESANGSTYRGPWHTMREAMAQCGVGYDIVIRATAPECWDGKTLDAADHHSHLSYAVANFCPATHPYLIPMLSAQLKFPVNSASLAGKWHLSSDEMQPGTEPGSTFHFDYWEAWSPTVRQAWYDNCFNKHLSCSNGDLGNGTWIKGGGEYNLPNNFPALALVPVSTIPTGTWASALTPTPTPTSINTSTTTTTSTTQTCADGSVILSTGSCPLPTFKRRGRKTTIV